MTSVKKQVYAPIALLRTLVHIPKISLGKS